MTLRLKRNKFKLDLICETEVVCHRASVAEWPVACHGFCACWRSALLIFPPTPPWALAVPARAPHPLPCRLLLPFHTRNPPAPFPFKPPLRWPTAGLRPCVRASVVSSSTRVCLQERGSRR